MGFGAAVRRPRHPDAIRLLSGVPDPGALPTRELADAAARVLAEPGVPALQYSRTEGIPLLREWIAAREGLPPERIVITNGGFHGLRSHSSRSSSPASSSPSTTRSSRSSSARSSS